MARRLPPSVPSSAMRQLLGIVRVRPGDQLFHRRGVEISDLKSAHEPQIDMPVAREADMTVGHDHVEAVLVEGWDRCPHALGCCEVIFDESVRAGILDYNEAAVRREAGTILVDMHHDVAIRDIHDIDT